MKDLILIILATLRLTQLLNYEEIFKPLREWLGVAHSPSGLTSFFGTPSKIKNFFGKAISCFSCTTVWAALGITGLSLISKKIGKFFNTFLTASLLALILKKLENKFLQ